MADSSTQILCPQCSKLCKGEKGLKLHLSKSDCGKKFSTASKVTIPVTGDTDTTASCPVCNKAYKNERGVKQHLSKSDCGKKVAGDKGFIARNGDTADSLEQFNFPVENKSKNFKNGKSSDMDPESFVKVPNEEAALPNRESAKVESGTDIPCTMCNKVFKTKRGLSLHLAKSDCGKKPANATITSDLDVKAKDLSQSLRSVTGDDETKASCVVCNKEFKNQKGLSLHLAKSNCGGDSKSRIKDSPQSPSRIGPDDKWPTEPKDSFRLKKEEVSVAKDILNKFVKNLVELLKDTELFPHMPFSIGELRSGSYYDKTKNNSPDEFDVMFFPENLRVEADFSDSPNGYCKIKVSFPKSVPSILVPAMDGDYLISGKFKEIFFGIFDKILASPKFHPGRNTKKKERDGESPAYTVLNSQNPGKIIDIDLVPCIQIDGWPSVARDVRPKWALDDTERIRCMKKYHAVAKTCPYEHVKDRHLLWRISFSWAEKILILRANSDTKYCCRKDVFRELKSMLEHVKSMPENQGKVKKFCSYHLKMFMLGQFDDGWTNNYRHERLTKCVENLHKQLGCDNEENCPFISNYFIPADNVIKAVPEAELRIVRGALTTKLRELQCSK